VRELRPAAIVHTAALTSTGICERDPEAAERANVSATRNLVEAAREIAGALDTASKNRPPYLIFTSTDLVFDGEAAPYREDSPTSPVMRYGQTKVAAEKIVLDYEGPRTVLRPAILYGLPAPGRPSFLEWIAGPLRRGEKVTLFTDEWRTPVRIEDVVEVIARLLATPCNGMLHCGGADRLSRLEMGEIVARRWNLDAGLLRAARRSDVALDCPRPRDVSLDSSLLARVLGFRPVGFREGIEQMPI